MVSIYIYDIYVYINYIYIPKIDGDRKTTNKTEGGSPPCTKLESNWVEVVVAFFLSLTSPNMRGIHWEPSALDLHDPLNNSTCNLFQEPPKILNKAYPRTWSKRVLSQTRRAVVVELHPLRCVDHLDQWSRPCPGPPSCQGLAGDPRAQSDHSRGRLLEAPSHRRQVPAIAMRRV